MKKTRIIAMLMVVALCLTTIGCGSTNGNQGTQNTGSSTSTKGAGGNTLTFAMASECETLDPGLCNYLSSSSVLMNLFMGLYMMDSDGKTLVNGCAESYDLSDDGLTYTFHLYDDLKWSDGSALTANDFKWSWIRELKPETASECASSLYVVKNAEKFAKGECDEDEVGISVPDDNTLVVTLESPTSYFLDITAEANMSPVKQSAVEKYDTWSQSADSYVCNGAFKVDEINHDESYVLSKNENYKYADKVSLDGVKIVFIEDGSAALTALKNGEVDATNNISTQAQTEFSGTDNLLNFDTIGTTYFDINCEQFSDARVRKALGMAIDKKTIAKSLVASKPEPATGFVPQGISYYGKDDDFRDVVGDLQGYDTDEAKKLLDEAVADGFKLADSYTIIIKNDDEQKKIAQAMQAMWKESLGINFEIVTYESGTYWDMFNQGEFGVGFDGWTGDYNDPNTMLEVFKADECESNHWSGDKAKEYDDLIKKCATETDQETRFKNFETAEKILMDDCPCIPLYYKVSQLLISTDRVDYMTSDALGHVLLKYTKLK